MAPFAARLASAEAMAHDAPIRASDIETDLGTRYTVDTLRAIAARYPNDRFVWLMGADNLAQFDQWHDWRGIADTVPIAVIARPDYDDYALAAPAMGWLRRFQRPVRQAKDWTTWSVPALVLLRFRPDPTSATQLRAADPAWYRRYSATPVKPETPKLQSQE